MVLVASGCASDEVSVEGSGDEESDMSEEVWSSCGGIISTVLEGGLAGGGLIVLVGEIVVQPIRVRVKIEVSPNVAKVFIFIMCYVSEA